MSATERFKNRTPTRQKCGSSLLFVTYAPNHPHFVSPSRRFPAHVTHVAFPFVHFAAARLPATSFQLTMSQMALT